MAIDYKKELETAAKSMILVHNPNALIKMIVRMIVQKVEVKHAGILLHQEDRDSYILTVSHGLRGLKIPSGFARMDANNPLIRFFKERKYKRHFKDGAILLAEIQKLANNHHGSNEDKQIYKDILYQMEIFDTVACVPSYFGDDLLGVLLLSKKKNNREFQREELDFFSALASDVTMAIRNARLFKQLEIEKDKLHDMFINTTVAFAQTIEAKDHYTHGHTERVTYLSLELAKALMKDSSLNINGEFLEQIHIAALLHDIGKIGVPESILNKEGPLNDEEWKTMKEHAARGARILQPIKELASVLLGVKYHHERYDGKGYPEGLIGDKIPIIAAIIGVADSYDAMTTDRPYRKAKSKEVAIAEIQSLSEKQFHPQVVSAMLQLSREGKL